MSGGTIVPRNECPGGQFFQGDIDASNTPFKSISRMHNSLSVTLLSAALSKCTSLQHSVQAGKR